jgi:hypothetical protein
MRRPDEWSPLVFGLRAENENRIRLISLLRKIFIQFSIRGFISAASGADSTENAENI